MNHKVTRDDVARLISGRPSRNRVGSRRVSHRLRLDEHTKLKVAAARGYLLVNKGTRPALRNSWFLLCQADQRPCVTVEHITDALRVTVTKEEKVCEVILPDLSAVESYLRSLFDTHSKLIRSFGLDH